MNQINWPLTHTELAELFGYKSAAVVSTTFNRLQKRGVLVKDKDYEVTKLQEHKYAPPEILWHKDGAIKVALGCRQAKAKVFLQNAGIEQRTEASDESRTLEIICSALKGYTGCKRKHPVESFQVDLYLPDLKIAVECDEYGHTNYSQEKEQRRQQYIEEHLGCEFIRYDPVDPVAVGNVINIIFMRLRRNQTARSATPKAEGNS